MFKRKGGGSKAFWTMLKKNCTFLVWRLPLVSSWLRNLLSNLSFTFLQLYVDSGRLCMSYLPWFFFANYLFNPGWKYSYELKNPLFNLPMLNFVSILETPHSSPHGQPSSRESDRKLLLPWLGSQRPVTGCLLSTEIINVLQIQS